VFKPSAWSKLEARYRVAASPVPLSPIGTAVLGGMMGRIRNMLAVGCTAEGLVLQRSGAITGTSAVHVPWAHVRRVSTPLLPLFLTPVESFSLGPEAIRLTLPQGHVPR
jgi:hypothetical protein